MDNMDKIIEQVVAAYDWEMSGVERRNIMYEGWNENTLSPIEAYNRQKRMGKEYDEQRTVLRRVLRRILPTVTPPDNQKLAEQLRPAAEQALQEAARKIEKQFNK